MSSQLYITLGGFDYVN